MTIAELVKQAHETAKEKGWWDKEPSFGELIALCHSELSEALEAYRNGLPEDQVVYGDGKKPEGVPIELADVVIRIADILGAYEIDVGRVDINHPSGWARLDIDKITFGEFLAEVHQCLSDAHSYKANFGLAAIVLVTAIELIRYYANHHNIDLDEAIKIKMEYNKTREYRHGGKVL